MSEAIVLRPGERLPRGTVIEILRACGHEPISKLIEVMATEAPSVGEQLNVYLKLMDYCYPKLKPVEASAQDKPKGRVTKDNVAELCRIARERQTETVGDEK